MFCELQGGAAPGAGRLCNGQSTAVPASARQSHSCPVDPAPGSKVLTCPRLGLANRRSRRLPPHTLAVPGGVGTAPSLLPKAWLLTSYHTGKGWAGFGIPLRAKSRGWKKQDCLEMGPSGRLFAGGSPC